MIIKILPLVSTLLSYNFAYADSIHIWPGTYSSNWQDSYVKIHEPVDPKAVATVTFYNTHTHQGDNTFFLSWSGIQVQINVYWNVNRTDAERIIVIPQHGYIAVPADLEVAEQSFGQIHIYTFYGM